MLRLHPRRRAEDATAGRRWLPPLNRDPTVPIAGPMAWHPTPVVPYDPSWPRVSECDDPANPGIANKLERLPVAYGVVVAPLGRLQRRGLLGVQVLGAVRLRLDVPRRRLQLLRGQLAKRVA